MDSSEIDPEMLENLDLLLNWDVAENEEDWDAISEVEQLDTDEATP